MKSLGLNSGRAILRLIYRDPEQLKTQAHISSPLLPKSAATTDDSSDKDYQRASSSSSSSVPQHYSKATDDNLSTRNVSSMENQEKAEVDARDNKFDASTSKRQEMDTSLKKENPLITSNQKNSDGKDQNIAERTKGQENETYEIKFVRCNCVDTQSCSSNIFTNR